MTTKTPTILRVDASARTTGSTTRALGDLFIQEIGGASSLTITERNVAEGLPFVNEAWVGANFTPEEERNVEQRQILSLSDSLIEELEAADIITIGLPIYNFGIPASLKAWIDLIARARKTFRYTPNGPVGLLEGKKAFVFAASGGTKAGSDIDFATPYIRHALAFIGIHDVTIISADQQGARGEDAIEAARQEITVAAKDLVTSRNQAA